MRRVVFFLICLIAATSGAQDLFVPASAHADGVGSTTWRTDLEVKAAGGEPAGFTVQLLRAGRNNSNPLEQSFTVAAGQSLRLEDVIAEVFEYDGLAALRVTATDGSILVSSRTYNDDSAGTYGQYIPAFPVEEAAQDGSDYALLQLSRSADPTTGYRTNAGFLNAGGTAIDVGVDLLTSAGVKLGDVAVHLRAYEMVQLNDIFGEVSETDVPQGYAIVRSDTSGARYFAYASVVDNGSGDAIFIPAQLEGLTEVEPEDRFVVFEAFMRDG